MTTPAVEGYPARLSITYPDRDLDRVSSAFRLLYAIPIVIVVSFVGSAGALFMPVLLMLLFRQKYPRWWFDFILGVARFSTRVGAYVLLMSDEYPTTDAEQYVRLDVDYPDATTLNRWLPLVKWFLAIPHFVVLSFLFLGGVFAWVWAWFVIVFTGRYPRGVFRYLEGVLAWALRVEAYSALLVTDRYPPFALR